MNWKEEAKEKLKKYAAMRLAIVNIPDEIKRLEIDAKNGRIEAVKAYSDSMDWQIAASTEQALAGCAFRVEDMCSALQAALDSTAAEDICRLLRHQNL